MEEKDGGPFARFAMTDRGRDDGEDEERRGAKRPREDPELDGPQTAAFEAATADVEAGGGVLVTGAGGCGKSVTLRAIRNWAAQRGVPIGVTSSMGRSADLVGGRTIHSFLGVGIADRPVELLAAPLLNPKPDSRRAKDAERLRALKILVVDEVSMLGAEFLDKASGLLSLVRGDARPFGGVRVAFFGDFCQLPPVEGGLAFEGAEWKRLAPRVVVLERSYRQDGDANARFRDVLGRVRLGEATDEDVAALAATAGNRFPEGVEPTMLYPTNAEVERENSRHFERLKRAGAARATFARRLLGDAGERADAELAESARVPASVELCDGAQVVVTYNVCQEMRLFNGARAVVVSVGPPDGSGPVRVRLASNGATVDLTEQTVERDGPEGERRARGKGPEKRRRVGFMPLRLAWASTIHGVQGQTLDCLEVDLARTFVPNQAYTALSRGTSLAGMRVLNVRKEHLRCDPRVARFYRDLRRKLESDRSRVRTRGLMSMLSSAGHATDRDPTTSAPASSVRMS